MLDALRALLGIVLITALIGGGAAWAGFLAGWAVQMFRMGWHLARTLVGP